MVFHIPVFYRFRDMAIYGSKSTIFFAVFTHFRVLFEAFLCKGIPGGT